MVQVLKELAGCWGEKELESGLIVWPSNEYLVERTLLTERALRYVLRDLISARLIASHDSPNGKRYAIRDIRGDIIDAYGFDLSPLFARRGEFDGILIARKLENDALDRRHDAITIARRAVEEALQQLSLHFPSIDTGAFQQAFEALRRGTPRRGQPAGVEETLRAFTALRADVEKAFYDAHLEEGNAGRPGKPFRHYETDNEIPIEAYQDARQGESGGVRQNEQGDVGIPTAVVVEACPALESYDLKVRSAEDLIGAARYLRPSIGAHPSAWQEAEDIIGPERAAILLLYVLQVHTDDVAMGANRINNPGGLFRTLARKVATGGFDLQAELLTLRRRHMT